MMEVERELYKVGVPDQDAPQRGRAEPVRSRADLRERQRRHRSPDDDDGDPAADGAEVRARVPAAREAVRRRQRLGQAPQLEHERRAGQQPAQPGETPHDNIQFLVFCAAVLRAVNKFQGLLRFSIASAGNDHRLGANEAPPAIISIFLGDMLTDIFQQIEKAGSAKTTKSGGIMDIGVNVLPKLPRDAGDRNRTSPFAFTGNKFEFRASRPTRASRCRTSALNVAVTESLDYVATELEKS
jgi:hypothetical protein